MNGSTSALDRFRLDGRVAVVIGGTGVLCGEMAAALGSAGARLVLVGRDEAKGAAAVARRRAEGHDAAFEPCEASERAALEALLSGVLSTHGRVDVVVNGAGVNSATPFLDIDDEELERIVAVN